MANAQDDPRPQAGAAVAAAAGVTAKAIGCADCGHFFKAKI